MNILQKSLLIGASSAIACLSLGTNSAQAVNFYFSTELFGDTFRGIFAGQDGVFNVGQIDAWEATAFEVTWRDLTWTLDGLEGLRAYHQPGESEGLVDWIVANTQNAAGETINLTYAALQQGVIQVRIGNIDGSGELGNQWIWTNGIPAPVGDPPWGRPGDDAPDSPGGEDPNPTSVPEPSLIGGLVALGLAGWLKRKDRVRSLT